MTTTNELIKFYSELKDMAHIIFYQKCTFWAQNDYIFHQMKSIVTNKIIMVRQINLCKNLFYSKFIGDIYILITYYNFLHL